jgi:hypothetical protein
MARARRELDDGGFDRAWAAGRALSLEEALHEAVGAGNP